MSKKSIVMSLLLVGAAACASTAATDRRDFKELAARTAIVGRSLQGRGQVPNLAGTLIDTLDLEVLSVCGRPTV